MNVVFGKIGLLKSTKVITYFYSIRTAKDIEQMIKNNKIVVFMKGVPEQPRCGFSNAVIQILRMHGVKYDAHDVLEDESLRQGT